ncbi:MAG: glycosyltransferase family 4 protein [Verrucomicrobiae bacterium]|nr:glycosyltransferase family 4 protein [Verrucomicrobiae bacterium]
MRDNAVAAGLRKLGHDVALVPLYTPIRTEDEDVSIDQVFFGGINVFLQQRFPLFRWLPGFLDHWLDNPKLIRRATARAVNVNAKELGALTLSMVRGEHGFQRKEVHRLVTWLRDEMKPDLICLTNLLVGGSIPAIQRELPGVPILVTLQGDDVFLDELTEPWRGKVMKEMKRLAASVDGFIVFNDFYRQRMGDLLAIPAEKFHRTALGVEEDHFTGIAEARAANPKSPESPRKLGYFARLCPEKGFDLIVDAFLDIAGRPGFEDVELHCGGWLSEKDRTFYDAQVAKIDQRGLSPRFNPVESPEFEGKIAFFHDLDVFSVPARFVEPKGIYALEAMACGIPVVAPDHGAFPEMIAASGGGRLVPRENATALADAVADLMENPASRRELGNSGQQWVTSSCGREAMARTTADVFGQFLKQKTK